MKPDQKNEDYGNDINIHWDYSLNGFERSIEHFKEWLSLSENLWGRNLQISVYIERETTEESPEIEVPSWKEILKIICRKLT